MTYKVFTNSSKIAAIKTSGNIYSYDAIQELNIKAKNWTDLLTGEDFSKKDIIVLQDPQNPSNREIENFEHLRKAAADIVRFLSMIFLFLLLLYVVPIHFTFRKAFLKQPTHPRIFVAMLQQVES